MKTKIEESKVLMSNRSGFLVATVLLLIVGVVCAACGVTADPSQMAAFVPFMFGPVDFKEVSKAIDEGKDSDEVKGFVAELVKRFAPAITLDGVKPLFDSDPAFKTFIQSREDARVTGAIRTYEEKTLPAKLKAHEDELRKVLAPMETEDQKAIRELREKIDKTERDSAFKDRRFKVSTELGKKSLPSEFVELLVAEDDEKTDARLGSFLSKFDEIVNARVTAEVEKRFKAAGVQPPKPEDGEHKEKKNLTDAEYLAAARQKKR